MAAARDRVGAVLEVVRPAGFRAVFRASTTGISCRCVVPQRRAFTGTFANEAGSRCLRNAGASRLFLGAAVRVDKLVDGNFMAAVVRGRGLRASACALTAAGLGLLVAAVRLGVGLTSDADAPGIGSPAVASAMSRIFMCVWSATGGTIPPEKGSGDIPLNARGRESAGALGL